MSGEIIYLNEAKKKLQQKSLNKSANDFQLERKKFLSSKEYEDAKEIASKNRLTSNEELIIDIIDFKYDTYSRIGEYNNFDDYINFADNKLSAMYESLKIRAVKIYVNHLYEKNELSDKLYFTIMHIAFYTSNLFTHLASRYIRTAELADGQNEFIIEMPDYYITNKFDIITGEKLKQQQAKIIEVSSLMELYKTQSYKDSDIIFVLKLSNVRLKQIPEIYSWTGTNKDVELEEIIKENNFTKNMIDDIFRVIYTYELKEKISKEIKIGLVTFTEDGRLKVKIDYNKDMIESNHQRRNR